MSISKNLILPAGSSLHRLIERAVRQGKTPYNYLVVFKDVAGIGIQMAWVDWMRPGQSYVSGLHQT